MAFINNEGRKISYECEALIAELKQDIAEFGGDTIFEVVVQEMEGVTIYKNYNFIDDDPETEFTLEEGERFIQMTGTALLMMLEKQNLLEV
ncbi:MAG: hypothetical protein K6G88_11785 [Lachnospiraceae bacterium]|nr:hypothetical protein [Lachnospiraceae bacterium]